MVEPLRIAYDAISDPKLFIFCGTDAISGGLFADSKAINRSVLKNIKADLYIPRSPSHPLTVVNVLLDLTRSNEKNK